MGGYSFRETNLGNAVLNGRIVGGHSSDDDRPRCVVRDVSGLKPWELAKVRTARSAKPAKAKPSSSRSEAAKKAWATMRARKAAKAEKVRKK